MSDYQVVRQVLLAEQRRRTIFYRYRPTERPAMDKEIADALAALDRLKRAGDWAGVARHWTEKFD